MSIKRSREESREIEALAMANCLMLLSQIGKTTMRDGRVFECKTCNKTFPSFQALGGHRASHKRPKIMAIDNDDDVNIHKLLVKPKTHECTICGAEFALGQALGGHMRRHRGATTNSDNSKETSSNTNSIEVAPAVPILKRCNSNKRVLPLDLNLRLGW